MSDNMSRAMQIMSENERTIRDLRDVLLRHGFVPCDIPACNCGSWHPRFGLYERMDEIKSDLAGADHPLTNANGNSPRGALRDLIAERDRLRAAVEALAAIVQRDRDSHIGGERYASVLAEYDAALRLAAEAMGEGK